MNRSQSHDSQVACLADLEPLAEARMSEPLRDYVGGGGMDEHTLAANCASFDRFIFIPRYLKDVTKVNTRTTCLGKQVAFPLGISPSAMHQLHHPDGEVATARAAAKKGVNMILSTYANCSVHDVAAPLVAAGQALSQQLSKVVDEDINDRILDRAQAAGATAVFLTIDCPTLGRRLRDVRCNFTLPPGTQLPSFPPDLDVMAVGGSTARTAYDASLTWDGLKQVKQRVHSRGLQLWLKGVLSPADASLAVEAGVDGILVSNHGGRQLDGSLSTLDALPGVVAAVAGRIPVHLDGGIRRGSDIFKALALGADHVWIGSSSLSARWTSFNFFFP